MGEMNKSYKDLLNTLQSGFLDPLLVKSRRDLLEIAMEDALDRLEGMQYGSPIWWGKGEEIDYERAWRQEMPEDSSSLKEVIPYIVQFLKGIPIYGHPETVSNVIPQSTISSIIGATLAAICNPNIMEEAYGGKACEAEIEVVSMTSSLIGYDKKKSCGFFTFGGTGTNMYGIKIGAQKVTKDGREKGLRKDVKVLTSDVSHYSILNVMDWLGMGTDNLIKIRSEEDNSISISDLEKELHKLLDNEEDIACIVPTLGTTDSFGVDNIKDVAKLRDDLVDEYSLDYIPHIHADSVIGWVFSVFNDYDFDKNSLGLPWSDDIKKINDKIKYLYLADSAGIDFHKLGYAPYISSLFILKDRKDLDLISRDESLMPYLYHTGHYHPGRYTLETSRGGGGVLSALSNLHFLGKNGYRVLLAHSVEMTMLFREKVKEIGAVILNDKNIGPSTLFRIYPEEYKDNRLDAYKKEIEDNASLLKVCNEYNERIFRRVDERVRSKGEGIIFSMTKRYKQTEYGADITALKAYMTSPHIKNENIESIVKEISNAITQIT